MNIHADFVLLATSKGGFVLTTNTPSYRYLNRERIKFRCSRGHEWQRSASAFRYGKLPWCRRCNLLGSDYWDKTAYEEYATKKGGELISCPDGDIMQGARLAFRCAKGHEWTCIAYSIKNQKSWCKHCLHDSLRGSIDEAHAIATERGGTLLSESYRRNSDQLKWRCHYKHVFDATLANIKKGKWCPYCSSSLSERIVRIYFEHLFGKKFPKTRPLWLVSKSGSRLELDGYCEELRLAFEHQGTQHYKPFGSITLADVKRVQRRDAIKRRLCRKHGVRLVEIPQLHLVTPLEALASTIDKKCRRHGIAIPPHRLAKPVPSNRAYLGDNEGQILDELRAIATTRGGCLLDSVYAGRTSELYFRCKKAHAFRRSPKDILLGRWCPQCSPTAKLTIDLMQQWAEERNGECLSKRYVASGGKLKWKCNVCGHHFRMSANGVQQGQWCPPCAITRTANKQRLTIEEVRRRAEGPHIQLVSTEYQNAVSKLKWLCLKCGHEWLATYNKIYGGQGCPMCARKNVWVTRRKNAHLRHKRAKRPTK
jgi:hypothetical protein